MMYRPYHRPRRRVRVFVVLIILVVVAAAAAFARSYKRWEGQSPEVMFDRDFKALGRAPVLSLTIQDPGTGLRHVNIRLKQKDQDVVLADEELNRDASKTYDVGKLITDKYKIQDGPASINVSVSDYAFRNMFKGNRTEVTKDFAFYVSPPRLEVLEGQHYINQGGS